MPEFTQMIAVLGIISTIVSLLAYFSGWADFASMMRELAARCGFPASTTTYYTTRMVLTVEEDGIVANFRTSMSNKTDYTSSIEATYKVPGSGKGILGPSSDTGYDEGFQNAQGTLFGFTSQPATKTGYTQLFFRDKNGQICIIENVNGKVSAKLPNSWRKYATGFLRIEGIQRRTIEFETVDFSMVPRRHLHFLVNVDLHGNLIYRGSLLVS